MANNYEVGRLTRRQLLRRGAQVGGGLTAFGLLAACGGSSGSATSSASAPTEATQEEETARAPSELTGEVAHVTYPEWYAPSVIEAFEQLHPKVKIKEVVGDYTSLSAIAQQVAQNIDAFDIVLADTTIAGQLEAGGFLEEVDFSKIPNNDLVAPRFRELFPWGVPTDYGKIGIGYRRDLVDEEITSWADLWEVAPKYSGKIDAIDVDRDTLGAALIYRGYSANSANEDEIEDAKQALIALKPHLRSLAVVGLGEPLAKGESVINIGYDFETAFVRQDNPDIEFVYPEEGMVAYLEGIVPIKGTQELDESLAYMDFVLEPKNYAAFVERLGQAPVMEAAREFLPDWMATEPLFSLDESILAQVTFIEFLGEDGVRLWNRAWNEFKSA